MTGVFEGLFGGPLPSNPGTDALADLLKGRTAKLNDTTKNRMANRQECAAKGHRYQVHGKTNPTKIVCARCEVSWGIGPRTEPS